MLNSLRQFLEERNKDQKIPVPDWENWQYVFKTVRQYYSITFNKMLTYTIFRRTNQIKLTDLTAGFLPHRYIYCNTYTYDNNLTVCVISSNGMAMGF